MAVILGINDFHAVALEAADDRTFVVRRSA